jgi:hypothetical protein
MVVVPGSGSVVAGHEYMCVYDVVTQLANNRNPVDSYINLATCNSCGVFGSCHESRQGWF